MKTGNRNFVDPGFTLSTFGGEGAVPRLTSQPVEKPPIGIGVGESIVAGERAESNLVSECALPDVAAEIVPDITGVKEEAVLGAQGPEQELGEILGDLAEAENPTEYEAAKTNLHAAIEGLGATFYDKRSSGGCLWIVADSAGRRARTMLVSCGMRLQLASEGGKVTGGSPAWWTKDPDPIQFSD